MRDPHPLNHESLEKLFTRAIALEGRERERFVAEIAAVQPEIAARVAALLAADAMQDSGSGLRGEDALIAVRSSAGVGGDAGILTGRKIGGFECYAPTDNVSELTARTNDEGWATVFVEWLRGSRLRAEDALLVLSVGGGNREQNVSPNLVAAVDFAKQVGARVIGLLGKDGGHTAKVADACVIVPVVNPGNITPHSEAFQAVLWHLFVSHPAVKVNQTKWESVAKP